MSTWASRMQIRELEESQYLALKRIKELELEVSVLHEALRKIDVIVEQDDFTDFHTFDKIHNLIANSLPFVRESNGKK